MGNKSSAHVPTVSHEVPTSHSTIVASDTVKNATHDITEAINNAINKAENATKEGTEQVRRAELAIKQNNLNSISLSRVANNTDAAAEVATKAAADIEKLINIMNTLENKATKAAADAIHAASEARAAATQVKEKESGTARGGRRKHRKRTQRKRR